MKRSKQTISLAQQGSKWIVTLPDGRAKAYSSQKSASAAMVHYARQRGVEIAGPRGVAIAGTMKSRVEHIIEMAKKHGPLVQHGKHWHLGSAKGGYATIEKFDRVPVVKGELPILLPKADEPSTALTMTEVRRMVRAMLEQKDKDSEGTK